MGKLTDRTVKSLPPGTYGDGVGLYLQVTGNARQQARSWLFRYKTGKKTTWMGLGGYPVVGLADARALALEAKKAIRAGIDPVAAKKDAKAAAADQAAQTFDVIAGKYIASHKAGWRSQKHGDQWAATLATYAFPVLGQKPVHAVTVAHVLEILEPIWAEKPETAGRVRGRIEAILDFATARKMRTGDNPARWKGNLDHLLPARAKVAKVQHHAAIPWRDMPAMMAALAQSNGNAAACLRFAILTAARSGEARGARWDEIDMAEKVWIVPGERMKAGQVHRVPLSDAALKILQAAYPLKDSQKPADGLVFAGGKIGRPLSDVALSKALAKAGGENFTVHGMRSTFREWAAERTSHPREIAEAALAHSNRDKVEAAYLRGDHFEKRRRLMDAWAAHANGAARSGVTITPIRATA